MDNQQATDALGRQFAGPTSYVAAQADGWRHQLPADGREGALKARTNQLGASAEGYVNAAREQLHAARNARLAGDTRGAHYHLHAATADRGSAMEHLGIQPSRRVFQRPNHWSHGDVPATRRLP